MTDRYDLREYDHQFFRDNQDEQFRFGDWVIPKLNKLLKPKSILDVGCAGGGQIELWKNLEKEAWGIEGSPNIDEIISRTAESFIVRHDLRDKLNQPVICPVDLVQSYEVAEHIEKEYSEIFVENIVIHYPKHIVMTAAPVGQDGTFHVNCAPKESWIEKFGKHHYNIDNEIEGEIKSWGNPPDCAGWFLPNLMVYKRG